MIRLLASLFLLLLSLHGDDESFVLQLKQKVQTEYKKEYPSIEISKIEIDSPPIAQKDGYRLLSSTIQKQNLQRNNGVLVCLFAKKSGGEKKFFLKYKLEASLPVAKARYNLQKDKLLTAADVIEESIAFKNLFSKPHNSSSVVGLMAKRYIPSGTVITHNDAKLPPAVRKGDSVEALLRDGSVEVGIEVLALQDGYEGESITVKSKSGKIMKAFVNMGGRLELR